MIPQDQLGNAMGGLIALLVLDKVFAFLKWSVDKLNGRDKDAEILDAIKGFTKVAEKIGFWLHDLKNTNKVQSELLKEFDETLKDQNKELSEIRHDGQQTGVMVKEIRTGINDLTLAQAKNG